MNEVIKVCNDKFAESVYSEVGYKLSILDDDDKYIAKRKKFTYQLYEYLDSDHSYYDTRTVFQYFEWLYANATTVRNYRDAINPERSVDIEFITEIENLFRDAAEKLEKHLNEIDHLVEIFPEDFCS